MCTHTCTPSHIRESAPIVEREGRRGGSGQSDISSWVPATVRKCHVIRPDASIKVRKSFQTVDSKRIITSLHHPVCLTLSVATVSSFSAHTGTNALKRVNLPFVFLALNLLSHKTQRHRVGKCWHALCFLLFYSVFVELNSLVKHIKPIWEPRKSH